MMMASTAYPGLNPSGEPAREAYPARYFRLFINRIEPVMRSSRGKWYCDQTRLKRAELQWAITGQASLGLYAVSKADRAKWLCLDADTDAAFRGLASLAATMSDQANLLVERSRRGGHLWLLCPPTPWEDVQNYGHYLALTYGLQKIEIFPKGPGLNGVKAPGSRHPKTGKVYEFLDPATGEVLRDSQATIMALKPQPLPRVLFHREAQVFGNSEQLPHQRSGESGQFKEMETDHWELCREIEQYTTLRHYEPTRAKGNCPLHDDRHPSLTVIDGYWRCWSGCGRGGLSAFRKLVKEQGL
jgi:hypothetical protein